MREQKTSKAGTIPLTCGLLLYCSTALLLLSVSAAAQQPGTDPVPDVVERRGGQPPLTGDVVVVDDAGVTVRSSLGASHFVPWDRVRDVRTDAVVGDLDARLEVATDLWRARSRVERRDTVLAEPLFSRLFERFAGRTHETALVVAEGLLRCRLARGDRARAVIAALEVSRLRRAGVETASYSTLKGVHDPDFDLCTALPPVWLPSPLLEALAADLDAYDAQGDDVVAAMAAVYRRSLPGVAAASGTASEEPPEHRGVELLRQVADCASPAPATRRNARRQLERALGGLPDWAEAWARYGIGAAMLAEDDLETRRRGAVSLVHLPARFGRTQPFLAGLAIERVAGVLEALGDAEGAAGLRTELDRSYPDHPLHTMSPPAGDHAS